MKIVHVCLANFYIDDYSYQENILPKYHQKIGLEVEIIASLVTFDKNGKISMFEQGSKYENEYGIPVTRLEYKRSILSKRLRRYRGTYQALVNAKPDIIFVHGCQFLDIKDVVNYVKKNPQVKVFVDNHADFNNSARTWLSKNILHKVIWRMCAKRISPYTSKFYGVLPARVDFLKQMYAIQEEKVDLLLMGADDEKVKEAQQKNLKNSLREKYGIKPSDFLIITGGKIDLAKKQILTLMKVVKNLNQENVKLIVFGTVVNEMKDELNSLVDDNKVKYIGWVPTKQSYNYFNMADLACFPSGHSVFWEQVTGLGIPMVVKYWHGTTHIDVGGNCIFLYKDSYQEMKEVIQKVTNHPTLYENMKKSALSKGINSFSYENIARKSIE